jgi:signal transduction histidine kinase
VQAGVAAHLADREPDRAGSALAAIESASHEALDELRAILGVLREANGAEVPLEPAPGLAGVPSLVDQFREAGGDVELQISGEQPDRLPEAVQLAAFRIVQESLTNAARHAPGAAARVRLAYEAERLSVSIENDSAPMGNGNGEAGVGIIGMRERVGALGGSLAAGPSAAGFRVEAELPYTRGP